MVGRLVLVAFAPLALGAIAASACGSDEPAGAASDAGSDAGAGGVSGAAGSGGSGGDAPIDAPDGDGALPEGCVDIRVDHSSLPGSTEWSPFGPTIGLSGDRDHMWRDAVGVHVAWNAAYENGGGVMVVSSYDAKSGALLKHRLFSTAGQFKGPGFLASGIAPDGTVGLGIAVYPTDAGYPDPALLLIRSDDPAFEKVYPLPTWPSSASSLVGASWDGEAFAVHGFGDGNVQYVTRVALDGTILLAPKAFGVTFGYAEEVRYVTDATEGVTYAVSGRSAPYFPWLTGHQRDGTPVPDPGKIQGIELQPQNFGPDGGWAGSVKRPALVAVTGGAGVAWSSGGDFLPVTTFVQGIGSALAASGDAIGIPGTPIPAPGNRACTTAMSG